MQLFSVKVEVRTHDISPTGLYDVLSHQFHVEAARLLGFTEEDFVKTLDWDSK